MKNSILSILRSFISGTPPENVEQLNLGELWQHASKHGLLPILAYVDKQWGIYQDPKLSAKLQTVFYGTIASSMNRCVTFDKLSEILTEHGISHMPVKGYYIRELYPVPELRTFGDLDILIHIEDRQKTDELLRQLGYTMTQGWEPTYSYLKGQEFYEIHTNLMDGNLDGRQDMMGYFEGAWEHCHVDRGLRYAPNLEFHLLYLICHMAKHLYGGGAGMRMYLDVALYLQRWQKDIRWDYLTQELEKLGLLNFFHTVLSCVQSWFDIVPQYTVPEPDSGLTDQLLAYTLDADLFGHLQNHSVVRLRNQEKPSKGRAMRTMLFPPAEKIESRYTFLQGHHWLLPAAWVVRLFANFKAIPERLRDLRQMADADMTDVDSYDTFMKRVGL